MCVHMHMHTSPCQLLDALSVQVRQKKKKSNIWGAKKNMFCFFLLQGENFFKIKA